MWYLQLLFVNDAYWWWWWWRWWLQWIFHTVLHRISSIIVERPSPRQRTAGQPAEGLRRWLRWLCHCACPAGARVYQTHTTTPRMRRTSCFNNSLPLFPFLCVDQRAPPPSATLPTDAVRAFFKRKKRFIINGAIFVPPRPELLRSRRQQSGNLR